MKISKSLAIASGVLLCVSAQNATAQDKAANKVLDQIVVTATRTELPKGSVGSSITVVDGDQIDATKQPTALEVLRTVPGLEVVQSGGAGRTTSVFIRGGNSNHTLVLIDGVRVNSNTLGSFDFADLKSDSIERIEVLRGAQSVLYGSEAMGGVINIITKKGTKETQTSVRLEGGSHGTSHGRVSVGSGNESIDFASSVSYFDTDGISAASSSNGNSEDDAHENFSSTSRLGANFAEDGRVDVTLVTSNSETELDGFTFGVGQTDDPNWDQDRDFVQSSVSFKKPINESVTPSLVLGGTYDRLVGEDPDTEFNNFKITSRTYQVSPQVDVVPFDNDVLTLGYTYERREGENVGNFDDTNHIRSFFASNRYSVDESLHLTLGVRNDDHSTFGGETTYRTTVSKEVSDWATRFHASYGTGFRAPTFNELSFPGFGNPDLDPETSWGYDFGIEKQFSQGDVLLDVTYFENEFEDLISFDPVTFTAVNIDEAEAWGIETTLDTSLCDISSLGLAYTYTDSENKQTGKLLARRPRHRASVNFNVEPLEGLTSTLTAIFVHGRKDSDGSSMDNYERVDLAVAYAVNEGLKPFFRIENLFDVDYEEVNGFGTPGFSAYGGVDIIW